MWGEVGLSIDKGGYLPYHLGIKSEHHIIWVNIATSVALVSNPSPSKSPAGIKLRLYHLKGGNKYISKFKLLVK